MSYVHTYLYCKKGTKSVNLRKFLWGKYFTWSAKSYSLIKTELLLLVPEKSTSKEMECKTTYMLGTPCMTAFLETVCRILKIKLSCHCFMLCLLTLPLILLAYHTCKGCYQPDLK